MNFKPFAQQIKDNFDSMSTKPLYRTNVGLDEIKDIYLASFPVGTNPVYITNTQHDCTCCKSFIRNVGGLVNVGNNMEHTWSGVDGEIFDDVSSLILDDNREMIDNNDFVEIKEPSKQESNIKRFLTEVELKESITAEFQEKLPALPLIGEDEYILLVDSVVIDIGPINKIEEQANLLVFGDHEICEGNPVPAENLLILKRVKIKVGLFLE